MSRQSHIFLIEDGGISNSLFSSYKLNEGTIDSFFESVDEKTVYSKIKVKMNPGIFSEDDVHKYEKTVDSNLEKTISDILARSKNFEYNDKLENIRKYCSEHSVNKVDEFFSIIRILREYDYDMFNSYDVVREYVNNYQTSVGIVYKETELIKGDLVHYKKKIYDYKFKKLSDNMIILSVFEIYFGDLFGKVLHSHDSLIGHKLNMEVFIE